MNNRDLFKELAKLEEQEVQEMASQPKATTNSQKQPAQKPLGTDESKDDIQPEGIKDKKTQAMNNSNDSHQELNLIGFRPSPFLRERILGTRHFLVSLGKFLELAIGNVIQTAGGFISLLEEDKQEDSKKDKKEQD